MLQPDNAEHLNAALVIAKSRVKDKDKKLARYVNEAMRFQPQTEIIPRVLTSDVDIAGSKLVKGQMVFVGLYAAVHDKRVVHNPSVFSVDRPETELAAGRLQFGYGRHSCLGQHLATAQAVSLMDKLFGKIQQLSFAPGSVIEFNQNGLGPFAVSLKVLFS